MRKLIIESLFIIVINIGIVILLIKVIQLWVSRLAKTSKDRFHSIYQGGEILEAKNRKYQSNLYVLIILFLLLHIIVFLISTLALIEITTNIAIELIFFTLIFLYAIIIIRKGVNYS